MRTILHGSGVQICTSLKVYSDPCMGSEAPAEQTQDDQLTHECQSLLCTMTEVQQSFSMYKHSPTAGD